MIDLDIGEKLFINIFFSILPLSISIFYLLPLATCLFLGKYFSFFYIYPFLLRYCLIIPRKKILKTYKLIKEKTTMLINFTQLLRYIQGRLEKGEICQIAEKLSGISEKSLSLLPIRKLSNIEICS